MVEGVCEKAFSVSSSGGNCSCINAETGCTSVGKVRTPNGKATKAAQHGKKKRSVFCYCAYCGTKPDHAFTRENITMLTVVPLFFPRFHHQKSVKMLPDKLSVVL